MFDEVTVNLFSSKVLLVLVNKLLSGRIYIYICVCVCVCVCVVLVGVWFVMK